MTAQTQAERKALAVALRRAEAAVRGAVDLTGLACPGCGAIRCAGWEQCVEMLQALRVQARQPTTVERQILLVLATLLRGLHDPERAWHAAFHFIGVTAPPAPATEPGEVLK